MDVQRAKDDLIQKIYGTLLGENSWQDFLDQLSGCLRDGKATLFFHDVNAGSGAFTITSGIEPKFLQNYAEYFSTVNPWMPGAAARPLGLAVQAEYMLARGDLRRTEYYNDFLRPQEIRSAIGVTVLKNQSRNLLLSVTTSSEDDSLLAQGTEILQALVPHLAKAFGAYRRRNDQSLMSFSETPSGVAFICLNENRSLKKTNPFAEDLLNLKDGIWVDRMGRFCSSDQRLIECIVDRMLPNSSTINGCSSIYVVRRRMSPFPLRIQVIPSPMTSELGFFGGPECRLFVEDLSKPANLDLPALRSYFTLTEAEARIVQGLVHGRTITGIASQTHITPNTARTHLKNIYAKMEVNRQAAVVQLARAFELSFNNGFR